MLQKLILLIITAIFLTGCGASAPVEDDALAEMAPEYSLQATAETVPALAEDTATVTEEPEEREDGPEYFYFTKYNNTVTDEQGHNLLIENRCTPTFVSADPERSAWVGETLDRIGREYAADSANLKEYAGDFVAEYGEELFYSYSNYQQLGVTRHDEAVVSLISLSSLYSGGAHPNAVQVAYNLDIANRRQLVLEDIIEEKAAPELAQMVREGVDLKFAMIDGGNGLFEDYGDTIDNSMVYGNMTPYWYLNDTGLVIFYNQYELGPYAAGIIKVELAYDALEGILLEDYFPVAGDGIPGDLKVVGAGESGSRISVTLDEQEEVLCIGVEGSVRQVQLSEVMWLEDTPIAQDLRFSALRLDEKDVLEIHGGYCDETKSYVLEFTDGRGVHQLYHIRDGELVTER